MSRRRRPRRPRRNSPDKTQAHDDLHHRHGRLGHGRRGRAAALREVAQAMINAAAAGSAKKVLEVPDIVARAAAPRG
jgi:hypothetical protein